MRSIPAITLGLACAVALVAGCAKHRADATVAQREATARRHGAPHVAAIPAPPRGAPRVLILAAPETIRLNPGEPVPQPTAEYTSLGAVRDSIGAILLRAFDPSDTAIHVSRSSATFAYWYAADSAAGWAFHILVTDTSRCPDSYLGSEIAAAGWAPHYGYSADGPDGSVMGYVSREYLCVIEARWDGCDDSDSTYVPAPGCEVTVTCVKRHAGDVPENGER